MSYGDNWENKKPNPFALFWIDSELAIDLMVEQLPRKPMSNYESDYHTITGLLLEHDW